MGRICGIITKQKMKYAEMSLSENNLSDKHYRQMILDLITKKGFATREDIVNLIMPTLSPIIPIEKRQRKISNITAKLAKERKKERKKDKKPVRLHKIFCLGIQ
jgi:ATP-dependent DNA helicase RecG